MNEDNFISFEILDERFTIKSTVDKDYYLSLVSLVKGKINKIRNRIPNLSNYKLACFAALDIADELMKLKDTALDDEEVKLINDLSDTLAAVMEDDDDREMWTGYDQDV